MLKDIVARNALRARELNRPEPDKPLSRTNVYPQDEAAASAGISIKLLGKIERGLQNTTLKTIRKLKFGYNLRDYELLDENGGIEGAQPCYATLNCFARYCVKRSDHTPDTEPSHLLDDLDNELLDHFTLERIETLAVRQHMKEEKLANGNIARSS